MDATASLLLRCWSTPSDVPSLALATFAPRPVLAAYRAPSTLGFGAPESVSQGPEDRGDATAAFDRARRSVVAWVGRPGYLGEFPQHERPAVRVSQRNE